jgi:toxin FitB
MILLDTNVLSALMHDLPDPGVVAWADRQVPEELWTTSISVFEIRFELGRLPAGRRRRGLEAAFEELLGEDLGGRVAPFDIAAATAAGHLAARRQAAGLSVDMRDTLIAGIALARRAVVATRNVRHFGDLETGTVDPWAERR